MKNILYLGTLKIKQFIKSKKASDDKNAGSAMAIVFAVVIGGLFINKMYGFLNIDFLPTLFKKLMDLFNFSGT